MYRKSRRLLGHIAFAGVLALMPPAIAVGTNMAMTADISSDNNANTSIVSNEVVAMSAAHPGAAALATHAPVRLSPLAGNDTTAWDSANSVRVWHRNPVK